MKCDNCEKLKTKGGLASMKGVLLCLDCISQGVDPLRIALIALKKSKREASEEKYERNYIAIEPARADLYAAEGLLWRVAGYFSNHKVAWTDDNKHTGRSEAQDHAEFLIKEFSMGGENNPIAIIHLDAMRMVLAKCGGLWVMTSEKVTDRL